MIDLLHLLTNVFCPHEVFVTVHPCDTGWHVVATGDELQHTHRRTFATRRKANKLATQVLNALDQGRHLDLRFWTTVELP